MLNESFVTIRIVRLIHLNKQQFTPISVIAAGSISDRSFLRRDFPNGEYTPDNLSVAIRF